MFLVDTNIWLESILAQERAAEVQDFLRRVEGRLLAVTEFSLYSVGVVVSRPGKHAACADFLTDTVSDTGLLRIRLDVPDLLRVLDVSNRSRLDFDDAYQYVAAEKYNLTIVSLDSDFDKTERGRKTPAQVMGELAAAERKED